MKTTVCKRRTGGFSLVELMVGMSVLTISVGAIASTLVATTGLNATTDEVERGHNAAVSVLEEIRSQEFSEVFQTYNGTSYSIAGMSPWPGESAVGTIIFPGDGTELREDVVDRGLGMPRDLNGDNVIDSLDHSSDYIVLPVRVRVRWSGRAGQLEQNIVSVLADF